MQPVTEAKSLLLTDFLENNRNAVVQKSVQEAGNLSVLH